MQKYWPGAVSFALFILVPSAMRHTQFERYITAYVGILLGLELLIFVALIVRRIRRKAQQTMP